MDSTAKKSYLSRRKFIILLFVGLGSLLAAIAAIPKRFFMWFIVGRRMPSEREVLAKIVAELPPERRFPCGDEKAKVVVARHSYLYWEQESATVPGGWMGRPDLTNVRCMLDSALVNLTGTRAVPDAYRTLFSPDDRVAIKVLWTVHLPILDPILRGLLSIGIPPENICMMDFRQLAHPWYEKPPQEVRLLAREPGEVYFNTYCRQYGVKTAGGDYSHRWESVGSLQTQLEQKLYDCTALINVATLKTHYLAETTLCLKNHQGSHLKPYLLHASLDVSLALLNNLAPIREKTRLAVLDATAPLYDQGPQTNNSISSWKYNGVIVGRDPVAVDTVGVSIIADKRREMGLDHTLPRSHDLLTNAEKLRLGRHDPAWIERIDIDCGQA